MSANENSVSLSDLDALGSPAEEQFDAANPVDDRENERFETCLHCGAEVVGDFCHKCGKPTTKSKRLNFKGFARSVITGLAELTPGFFHTSWHLMIHPWKVIRDCIHGKRKAYAHPVSMIIQFSLYMTTIYLIIENFIGVSLFPAVEYKSSSWLMQSIKESAIIRLLWVSIPYIFTVYLVYWRHGSRRFNFAEYLLAALYICMCLRLYVFFLIPVNLLPPIDPEVDNIHLLIIVVGLVIGSIAIWKAFPIKSKWRAVVRLVYFYILLFFVLSIYYTIFKILDEVLIEGVPLADSFRDKFVE